jgi:hypothetical protein
MRLFGKYKLLNAQKHIEKRFNLSTQVCFIKRKVLPRFVTLRSTLLSIAGNKRRWFSSGFSDYNKLNHYRAIHVFSINMICASMAGAETYQMIPSFQLAAKQSAVRWDIPVTALLQTATGKHVIKLPNNRCDPRRVFRRAVKKGRIFVWLDI